MIPTTGGVALAGGGGGLCFYAPPPYAFSCEGLAAGHRCGSLSVTNIYPLRSTEGIVLYGVRIGGCYCLSPIVRGAVTVCQERLVPVGKIKHTNTLDV
jgi:hypothetical protein